MVPQQAALGTVAQLSRFGILSDITFRIHIRPSPEEGHDQLDLLVRRAIGRDGRTRPHGLLTRALDKRSGSSMLPFVLSHEVKTTSSTATQHDSSVITRMFNQVHEFVDFAFKSRLSF